MPQDQAGTVHLGNRTSSQKESTDRRPDLLTSAAASQPGSQRPEEGSQSHLLLPEEPEGGRRGGDGQGQLLPPTHPGSPAGF